MERSSRLPIRVGRLLEKVVTLYDDQKIPVSPKENRFPYRSMKDCL